MSTTLCYGYHVEWSNGLNGLIEATILTDIILHFVIIS